MSAPYMALRDNVDLNKSLSYNFKNYIIILRLILPDYLLAPEVFYAPDQ